uniref:Paraneoplastic antigen Ma1 homolog n=1 Tax=Acanthochromis polyacanthus TaxID=80966 RepID=A0A3Q1HIA0_9TELE
MTKRLSNWCRGEGLQEDQALMVIVPETTEIAAIEEALEAIKVLGRVRVRGRMFSARLRGLMVLCESKEKIKADNVPPEVHPGEGQEAWPIVIISEKAVTDDDFSVKLTSLLQAEGKTVEDVQALFPGQSPAPSSTEAILRAVGDLLDKAAKPAAESGSYRRLRIFSGTLPTPAGEESFDHWLEQANLMVAESDCPEKEKRRRIMESVKGPAMEILKAVRLSDPDVSPEHCIEALESAFGTAESGDDLYFSFRLMQQQSGEKLSDFLRRLERSLTKVIQKGGLPVSQIDRARVEQLLRGAVTSDLMLIRLRLRERKNNPPNFLELLSEVRSEEEYEASRAKLTPSVLEIASVFSFKHCYCGDTKILM